MRYLNFDYYKKHNANLNENWIRDRRLLIIKKLENFEKRLEMTSSVIRNQLNSEMFRLHTKRIQQYDKLMSKYTKLKNMVYEINAKEMYHMKKLKHFFLMKANVPKFSYDAETDDIGLLAQTGMGMQKNTSKTLKEDLNVSQNSQKTVSKAKSRIY